MQRCQDIPELPRHIVVIMDRNDGPRYLKIQSCQSYSTRKIVHSGRHVHLLVHQCLLTPCESFLKLKVIIKWHWTSLPQSTQPAAHELLRTWLLLGGCQLPLLWMLLTATAQTIWPSTRTSKTTQWGPTAQVQRKHSESQAQAVPVSALHWSFRFRHGELADRTGSMIGMGGQAAMQEISVKLRMTGISHLYDLYIVVLLSNRMSRKLVSEIQCKALVH